MWKIWVICLIMTLFLILIPFCNNLAFAQGKESNREITDMVGRKVTVPCEINKIYAPIYGTVILNAIVPDKLVKLPNLMGDSGIKVPMSKRIG
ncbi:hypothetical protein SOV_51890 [Sporomusa ovata DSM 2662]|uniref:Uncharacterized protein n=1 Tax=Sporomusa ovata TaxID=2378 RepID=A0A0U1L147_9FIRM|nr:hypothetical protein [Sporomusa ovata]EQB27561.1 hypothetical protein SOV_2c04580 [Sporomusa ovata DSM 2662]CQR73410.1 hypothetical protein SpAn4DRAFT_2642 [Sporomusa ovata]